MTTATEPRTILRHAFTINPGDRIRQDGIIVTVTGVERDHDRRHVTVTVDYGAPRTVTFDAAVPLVQRPTIHLQGIGSVPAVPLSEVKAGDWLRWNYGGTYEVVRNVQVTAQTWELTERDKNGREYTRCKRGATLVSRVPSPEQLRALRYAAKFRAETMSAEPPVLLAPTDENLAATLAGCVRPARPEEYPAIREALTNWNA